MKRTLLRVHLALKVMGLTGSLLLLLGLAFAAATERMGYIGSRRCGYCHQEKYDSWVSTPHATFYTPLSAGRLKGEEATWPEGLKREDIRWVVGGRVVQRYLTEREGSHRFLPWEWYEAGKQWRPYHPGDWMELRWEERCAGCHTTAHDPGTGRYAELNIGCEACHGTLSRHKNRFVGRDLHMVSFARVGAREELMVCAQCHLEGGRSKDGRYPFPVGMQPGEDLLQHYEPALATLGDPNRVRGDGAALVDLHDEKVFRGILFPEHPQNPVPPRCTACHELHGGSTARHRQLDPALPICRECHSGPRPEEGTWALLSKSLDCNVCDVSVSPGEERE